MLACFLSRLLAVWWVCNYGMLNNNNAIVTIIWSDMYVQCILHAAGGDESPPVRFSKKYWLKSEKTDGIGPREGTPVSDGYFDL